RLPQWRRPSTPPRGARRALRRSSRSSGVDRAAAAATSPHFGGVGADLARFYDVSLIAFPRVRREIGERRHHAEAVCYLFRIRAAMERLHLQQRHFGAEDDGHVRFDEADIGEEWPEPAVAFHDAFVRLVGQIAGQVRWRPYQDAPVLRARDEQAGPQLDDARLGNGAEERRRESSQPLRRRTVKYRLKAGELRTGERVPAFGTTIRPDDL